MTTWEVYTANRAQHSVVGDLRVTRGFYSPQFDNQRDVFVWLPSSYAQSDKHYPVLYMHDAQNLFDAHTSYAGEWQIDEAMQALSAEGYEAIIVGLPNMNEQRRIEYNPYPTAIIEGAGAAYVRFIVDTVKPMIDHEFRTLPDSANTGIGGSSMGGLISLYAMLEHPTVFGFCGCFSPAYWFGNNGLARTVSALANGAGKVYLDVGTKEGDIFVGMPPEIRFESDDYNAAYVEGVREIKRGLLARGYTEGDTLLYVEEADAPHNESAWARRLPAALRFLLPKGS
jgi:predicted alpha/beta superfamily hydrolase